jgi:FtsP/CotA-like multicopper oxidase with cupredoxin domain
MISLGGAMRKSVVAVASVIAVISLGSGPGLAQTPSRVVSNPRVLGATAAPQALLQGNALTEKAAPTAGREKRLHLKIVYTDGKIYNPATQTYDKVHLRSYNGTDVSPDTPYVAPTIEVKPGQTVRIDLDNQLPTDPTCAGQHPLNTPHCFNTTNLHSHGLWVSPTGNSDNVLLSIGPQQQFEYEYNIPEDHPAGTFWYHTHQHGSTALQVSSGMAGALIVRGNRLPTASAHGDLETLLYQDGKPVPEQVVLFQQIQYACLDKAGNIKVKMGPDPKDPTKQVVVAWVCDKGDVGGIETYGDANGNGFGPPSW